ncbi:bifunctional proline dehydrogenase/L-glutamate gamma-semialdehyde dehydrogenase PutA [Mesorhizobium sp. AD1-1]|uniref:bifunctional proline dehydrogenase/L-glutamate gamma-semialdehyde dehydrogenase PutA n=1 Tax=Mesorhizobium sp. AD1-1 TaxID=2876621 RepID=UPI001CCA2B15|nr:bifunctional proline dehydrogenase/L-glutamate gamma-semialdehyde dehydrogenase PutA [Mesorhizobium sp. AD1-1]MBZ9719189.1 bifunctional proline dehydrogenase/L-glutamate gamma-semialdehyde dehydrogenase PutA [Mesorhizobium sp. AD1-1]
MNLQASNDKLVSNRAKSGELDLLWEELGRHYREDEEDALRRLSIQADLGQEADRRISRQAAKFVETMRAKGISASSLETFMAEYKLTESEGLGLMCIAEALIRIPDRQISDALIADKLAGGDWLKFTGRKKSAQINLSSMGLHIAGRSLRYFGSEQIPVLDSLRSLSAKLGEPAIRSAVRAAMGTLSRQFIVGQTIGEALHGMAPYNARGYTFSFDMLGEAARSEADAERYFGSYLDAIESIGKIAAGKTLRDRPGISVKLSALHPRYEFAQRDRVLVELTKRLRSLTLAAKQANISLTVDAEEADRLELSLEILARVFRDSELGDWEGFGLVVQAYQKRAPYVLDWLAALSGQVGRRLMIRLVKGGYWDTEIKFAQVKGFEDYPVFTRKAATDISYIACVRKLLAKPDCFYPMFATHNARTVATILELTKETRDFEFQRLHGMGEGLYNQIVGTGGIRIPCRVYAPVGGHDDLLPYLVRRLLENGASSAFVSKVADPEVPVSEVIADPVSIVRQLPTLRDPRIPVPPLLFGAARANSGGYDLSDSFKRTSLLRQLEELDGRHFSAAPLVNGEKKAGPSRIALSPISADITVGFVTDASPSDIASALQIASQAWPRWNATPVEERARCLERLADLLQERQVELVSLLVREAGKTIPDTFPEIREAIDFCRYYATEARRLLAEPVLLPGATGERNEFTYSARGVQVCISPWNFPVAIFLGQIVAALVTGNSVIAKPAEQTPLIGAFVSDLILEAGIPKDVFHFLPGTGEAVGAAIVENAIVAGVAFTGSTETAKLINQKLAAKDGPIARLVAETGGLNCIIADSSALPEQVVRDILLSAFQTAGQRCSAARLLVVQEEIADKVIRMLAGAMAELITGDPRSLSTDIGPVIDEAAQKALQAHIDTMQNSARPIAVARLGSKATGTGFYIAPHAFEITSIGDLKREVFGPIIHVVRYSSDKLHEVVNQINQSGYGLTLGIHSRTDRNVNLVRSRARAGNIYVNRDIIGAVVGVQPFGGEGLSGTGPKAGGPNYLMHFLTERTLSIDTTAAGGNASLVAEQYD